MNYSNIWQTLLSNHRLDEHLQTIPSNSIDARNPFERDIGRIVYSYPFRRMQDKTQVIPFPPIDFVHSRLTHSVEVATVGRSFGLMIEKFLLEKDYIDYKQFGFIPAILYAAGLAHDMGNPPFGHAGEQSISKGFKELFDKNSTLTLSEQQQQDLTNFEGNAFGFKLLVNPHNNSYINVTYATLASFTKYPCSSIQNKTVKNKVSNKKYGFFESEQDIFYKVFNSLGLLSKENNLFKRHPLAFLSEAADDICYRIMDFEDGVRLKLIDYNLGIELLSKLAPNINQKKLSLIKSNNEKIAYLRAVSIGFLAEECARVFINKHDQIIDGSFDDYLIENIDVDPIIINTLNQIKEITFNQVYRSKEALYAEVCGNNILSYLIELFGNAVITSNDRLIKLLPEEHRPNSLDSDYQKLLKVASYIAGMTDSYAKKIYKTFTI